jgi:flavin reductase (DIM6/NTAB) family NADH-FMN oxidoreductase RutF
MDWLPAARTAIASILDRIPNGFFVLTAAHGDVRCGAVVRWVQQCAKSPPMLLVAIEKGQALSAIIRDSHGFALCQLHRDERILRRMLPAMPENGVDPFISIPHMRTPSGAPVPLRAMSWFDCEMVRHIDIEADTEIYVGVVHHASTVQPGAAVPCHCAVEPSCPETLAVNHRAAVNGTGTGSRPQPMVRPTPHVEAKRAHRSAGTVSAAARPAKRR